MKYTRADFIIGWLYSLHGLMTSCTSEFIQECVDNIPNQIQCLQRVKNYPERMVPKVGHMSADGSGALFTLFPKDDGLHNGRSYSYFLLRNEKILVR